MTRAAAPLLILTLLAAGAAGCLDDRLAREPYGSDRFFDADESFGSAVNGTEKVMREFRVPPEKGSLLVKVFYRVDGNASFILSDPSGKVAKKEQIQGEKRVEDITWFETTNPREGGWKLEINITGSAEYVFGFYARGELLPDPIQDYFKDARFRVTNKIDGRDETLRTFDIPISELTGSLTVKAAYRVDGLADFILRNPLGLVERHDEPKGSKRLEPQTWHTEPNPLPGTWRLELDVSGSAEYAFGVYY